MRILIFGSTGYIGAYLTKYYYDQGIHTVFPILREKSKQRVDGIEFFQNGIVGNIHDADFISKVIRDVSPDAVIYCISLNHVESQHDLNEAIKNNVSPLASVLIELEKLNKSVRFLYFSTLQIFGDYKSFKTVNEMTNPSPLNHYALTHKICDDVIEYYGKISQIRTTSLILSNSYGYPLLKDTDCWWLVMNDFCRSAILNNKIDIRSDGSPQRDFISLSEVCLKVDDILLNHNKNKIIISSGVTYTIYDLAKKVQERIALLFNKSIEILDSEGKNFKYLNKNSSANLVTIKSTVENLYGVNNGSNMDASIDELLISILQNKKDII
jgi:UDP-glucose 4-epimerase